MNFDSTQTRKLFEGRLESLENDAKRAYATIDGIRPAPFPIMMYAFAMIDYFSSCWAGWNDKKRRPTHDGRNQTDRMIDFLERYMKYPKKESRVAIQIWRHKLMHTSEPRNLKDPNNQETYSWSLYGDTAIPKDLHWTFKKDGRTIILSMGIFHLVDDLRNGIFGGNGYFDELCHSIDLQQNYEKMQDELERYTLASI